MTGTPDILASDVVRSILETFDPFDERLVDHFYETFETMREQCPVLHSDAHGGFWTVTRYSEAAKVLQDARLFSNRASGSVRWDARNLPLLPMVADPPEHSELRRILNPSFTPAAMAVHEPGIRAICSELIDTFIENARCEFVSEFAFRLPERVLFGEVLDLPLEDAEGLHREVQRMQYGRDDEVQTAYEGIRSYAKKVLDRRRAEAPTGDFIDAMLEGTMSGEPLDEDRMLRTLVLIIMGGLDTTARVIANICYWLAKRPDLRAQLEAHPDQIPQAVEEFLRFESVAGGIVRLTRREVELAGTTIPEGERILVLIAAADRDATVFADADEIGIARGTNRHLAFGLGPHRCLGMHLARLELRVATEEIVRRLSDMDVDAAIPLTYSRSTSRGLTQLGITFRPSSRVCTSSA